MPLLFDRDVLLARRRAKARKIGNQIVASSVSEEDSVGRHDGRAAHFARIVEVHFEPECGTASAYLGKIGALAAVDCAPCARMSIMRVAAGTVLGDVDEAAAFDGI